MLNFTSVKKILLFLSKTISQLQTTLTTMLAQIFQSMRAINFMTTKTFNSKGLFSSWENMSKKNLAAALSFDSKSNATTAPLTTKTSVVFLPFQLLNYVYTNLSYEKYNSIWMRFFGVGFFYLSYSCFIMYIDACLTDDEPLWEPIEWSLVQTWILFLFTFAWIAENLIVSRYGSYTGRDKRVWFAWYKTFWLCEGYYIINFGAVVLLVIVPYYYETNYDVSFLFSWWHWYSRVFFFKFISLFSLILILALVLQMSVRWLFWKKSLLLIIFINIFIGYLLYTHFIMAFFGYFTDPVWYQKKPGPLITFNLATSLLDGVEVRQKKTILHTTEYELFFGLRMTVHTPLRFYYCIFIYSSHYFFYTFIELLYFDVCIQPAKYP
jgi:hypothetical protein